MMTISDTCYPLPLAQCHFVPYQIFTGNTDRNTKITNIFPEPVTARCIRINPRTWKSYVNMRFDVLGCLLEPTVKFNSSATQCMYTLIVPMRYFWCGSICYMFWEKVQVGKDQKKIPTPKTEVGKNQTNNQGPVVQN